MVNKLFKKGYQAHIKSNKKNRSSLFKVHVDQFSDKKQALNLVEKFSTEENIPSFITIASPN
jgi:hypothetical protein